jgi:hypothetical protein
MFQASTGIKVGDGMKAIFYHDKWLEGKAPKEIAPDLYNLGHFKRRSVAKGIVGQYNWIYTVHHISTAEELREYIKLWELLRNVSLNGLQKDSIIWKWTADGSYSTASAYKMQFQGSYVPVPCGKALESQSRVKSKILWMDCNA